MKLENNILEAIDIIVKERLTSLPFNYYLDGIITVVNGDGTYQVLINEQTYTLKARTGLSLNVNDIVLVCVINNDFSRKFIDIKRI